MRLEKACENYQNTKNTEMGNLAGRSLPRNTCVCGEEGRGKTPFNLLFIEF
jgi:type IV secretory pathway VirB4 component